MIDIKRLAYEYFEAFSSRDIDAVRATLAEAATLRDWVLSKQGIDEVLAATAEIFSGCNTVKVTVGSLYAEGSVALAELEISFDGAAPILVLDVLEFDGAGRIKSIRAFKG